MKITNKPTLLIAAAIIFLMSVSSTVFAQAAGERSSFNENWSFQKDDPGGAEGKLEYDKIKNWVTPTGNEFVLTSGGAKGVRPNGNLGEDVEYTRRDFNDSSWRKLNLPHDWAIEGDFQQPLPGETGKRPWTGIGWYRKHFTVSPNDNGKQIYLDFDGAMSHPTVWGERQICRRLGLWLRLVPA